MADSIELSIEETNKLRAQIGLPLIPTENSRPEKQDSDGLSMAETNKLRVSLGLTPLVESEPAAGDGKRSDTKTLEEKPSLKVTTRSETEKPRKHKVTFQYDDVDTDSWLDSLGAGAGIFQNKNANPSEVHVSGDEEAVPTTIKHGAKGLALLADGEIFTLADSGILDDAGDELVNEKLAKEAKLEKDKKEREKEGFLKFGRPRSEEETKEDDESSEPEQTLLHGGTILLQQKIENDGTKDPRDGADGAGGHTTRVQGLFEDLDPAETAGPARKVSMKKIKSKKSKGSSKKRQRDDDLMESVGPMYTTALEAEEEMEDDLGEILSRARSTKHKTRKVMTAEEIANEVRLHMRVDMAAEADSGWVFDDTKEFLDTLGTEPVNVKEATPKAHENAVDTKKQVSANMEIPDEKPVSEEAYEGEIISPETVDSVPEPASETSALPNLSSVLATLKYLRAKQEVTDTRNSHVSKMERERRREAELAKIQIGIEERIVREQMAADAAFARLKPEEQEKTVDRLLNERLVQKGLVSEPKKGGKYARYGELDPLKDYSPQVNVEYKDARGNKLDRKQAWKELLHKYHGLAPKHKKDPVVKKSTEEKVIR